MRMACSALSALAVSALALVGTVARASDGGFRGKRACTTDADWQRR